MKISAQFSQTIEIEVNDNIVYVSIQYNNNNITLHLTPGEAYIMGEALRLTGQVEMARGKAR